MFDLSIVIPTQNRADALLKSLMSLEHSTHSTYEVIVVDGASTDATGGVLMLASSIMGTRLRVVREAADVGFGTACNKGVAIARGRNLTVLHNDVQPLDGALDRAIEQLDDSDDEWTILALLSRQNLNDDIAVRRTVNGMTFAATHIRGTLVADFPLARRSAFETIGFDGGLKSSLATADFSLRGWARGFHVVPASSSPINCLSTRLEQDLLYAAERESITARSNLPAANTPFELQSPCTMKKTGVRKAA